MSRTSSIYPKDDERIFYDSPVLASRCTNNDGHPISDSWSLSNDTPSPESQDFKDNSKRSRVSNENVQSFESDNSHEELSSNPSSNNDDDDQGRRRRILFCQHPINLIRGRGVFKNNSSTSEHEEELNSLLEEAISEK
jgi:hypothetical protein